MLPITDQERPLTLSNDAFDPGAADGLMGTQTMLEYLQDALWPSGLTFRRVNCAPAVFRGIEGNPKESGMRASLPIDLGPFVSEYEADTIGEQGDRCPEPVTTLRRNRGLGTDQGDMPDRLPEPETTLRSKRGFRRLDDW